jgi:hypothetical protein
VVDQQVRVSRGRPAGGAVGEPLEQYLAREVVERTGPAVDGDPPVAEINVVEAALADRLDAGGVHRGEDQAQPGLGSDAASAAWSTSSWLKSMVAMMVMLSVMLVPTST